MIKKSVQIVGAGPAGLCAAINLAKHGCDVHIHERYDTVGKRFCGDLQGIENWSTKENVLEKLQSYGLNTNFNATPFYDVTFTDGYHSFNSHSKEPLFYLVKRGPFDDSLDTALRQQAESQHVQIHYRSTYPLNEADIVATGPIRQATVAADKGLVFKTNLPNMAIALFHDELAHLGYSYLVIAEGYGCICTVVFKDNHKLNRCFEKTLESAKRLVKLNLDDAQPVGGLGSFSLNHPTMLGGARLVGEAAGFQDLLWGFGIRTALTSGYLAAQSLITGKDYYSLAQTHLQDYLKATLVNRYIWEKFKWRQRPLLPFFLKLPISSRTCFKTLYNFTFCHRMIYPFANDFIKDNYPHSVDWQGDDNSENNSLSLKEEEHANV